jgi:hypothetical protein
MPRDTLWPALKGVAKYTLILSGGRMLRDGLLGADAAPPRFDLARLLGGLVLLAALHCGLRWHVRRRQEQRLWRERSERGRRAQGEAAVAPAGGAGPALRALITFGRELPKLALGALGAALLIDGSLVLDEAWLWFAGRAQNAGLGFLAGAGLIPRALRTVVGLGLLEAGYLLLALGIRHEHGPCLRRARVDDRRIEGLRRERGKLRGFWAHVEKRQAAPETSETTPTADVWVHLRGPNAPHKPTHYIITYRKDLEPAPRSLLPVHLEHVQFVKQALRDLLGKRPVPSLQMYKVDLHALRSYLQDQLKVSITDEDITRVVVAMERADSADVTRLSDEALLKAVNDAGPAFRAGLFSRTFYKYDEAGRLAPAFTIQEDLKEIDRISRSLKTGYGANYWRKGRALMAFRFFRGAAEDGELMRTSVRELRLRAPERWWQWGDTYRWEFRESVFQIDNTWIASLTWLTPGPWVPRRRYVVREGRRIVALCEESLPRKLLLGVDWNIHIFDQQLNNEEGVAVLSLLTEFLHFRSRYLGARTSPGNSAYERLLVAGHRLTQDAADWPVAGL